jgi:hypothetical protein
MILAIGPGGCGFTFLTWSIIYLRGNTEYTLLDKTNIEVVDNPLLSNYTAHGQQNDHIFHTNNLKNLNLATEQSVVYVVPTRQLDLDHLVQLAGKKIIFNSFTSSEELFARMYYTLLDHDNPLIKFIQQLLEKYNEQAVKQVLVDCSKFFTRYSSVSTSYSDYFNIDYNDIFQNLDHRIYDIFEYLELTISPDRLDNWLSVYHTYRLKNQDFLSKFLNNHIEIEHSKKIEILKDIIQWKNGSYLNT